MAEFNPDHDDPCPGPGWEWCPEHDAWYRAETDCPDCLDGNEGDWDPDDWVSLADGWYEALCYLAGSDGWDPHCPWRM